MNKCIIETDTGTVFESFRDRDLKDTGSCDEPGAGAPLVLLHRGEPLGRVSREKVQTSLKHTQREGLYALSIRSRGVGQWVIIGNLKFEANFEVL